MARHAIDDLRELDQRVGEARAWLEKSGLVVADTSHRDAPSLSLDHHGIRHLELTDMLRDELRERFIKHAMQLDQELREVFDRKAKELRADLARKASEEAKSVLRELGETAP